MNNYSTLYVGLDVHKETIVAACISGATGEIVGGEKFSNDLKKLKNYLKQLERKLNGKVLACYEAGCMGYALQREIERWGHTCKILAPAMIPQRPGDRCKTDRRDAEKLANLCFSDQLTFIAIPDEKDEPVRDLLRYRDVLRKEILQSKHYVLKFLLRKGFGIHQVKPIGQDVTGSGSAPFVLITLSIVSSSRNTSCFWSSNSSVRMKLTGGLKKYQEHPGTQKK
ncbi:MAG: transposase [Candidatus Eremiobacteraeota bacterium]|nr:transposase [Candidatus Eremiobacteraeota bacterium]